VLRFAGQRQYGVVVVETVEEEVVVVVGVLEDDEELEELELVVEVGACRRGVTQRKART